MNNYKNLFIRTMGCQMNEYDSEKIIQTLKQYFKIKTVYNESIADILIINTCSIREKAQEKLFDQLGRWNKLKLINKNIMICVGGCVASQEGKEIFKRAPYVDIIFGPQTLHRLSKLITERIEKKNRQIDISFPEIEKFNYFPIPKTKHCKAYVSIMEGCDKYCSYCIVPYTRGKEINRPFDDVIAECFLLVQQGVKEITLLGQNVNHYRGLLPSGEIADLAMLITFLNKIKELKRIRFTTSHPAEFSDNLINIYANIKKLVNHLHLPVQHASNKILKAMKRNYLIEDFKEKIKKIKKIRPTISISSDFIIGFPGETEKDFLELLDLIKEIGFDQSYSFIYSKRPGTIASNLLDTISLKTKKNRLTAIQKQLNHNAMLISRKMLNTVEPILVDSYSNNLLSGRTENNRIVHFFGDKEKYQGKIVNVSITQILPHCLKGYIINDKFM